MEPDSRSRENEMPLTAIVSEMVSEATYDDLSSDVIEKTKLLILDHLGCLLAGSQTSESKMLTQYIAGTDGGGEATVFGAGKRFSTANAAHANGHAVTILSLDDSYIRYGHPGNGIIPAALAVGESLDVMGKDLICAIVAGYEMSLRLGVALKPTVERFQKVKGYATWQIFGAVTAAAKLHALSVHQMADAYGIAAMHAPPPFLRKFQSRPMNWLKNNYGWACKCGVIAVDLAMAGFHGNRTIFDGDTGYWAIAGSDRFNPDMFVLPFCERSFVREVGFKPYGVCRSIHTTVDCVRRLINEEGLMRDNFESIEIETVSEFVERLNGDWPETNLEAVLHIPYAVALELHGKTSALGLREEDLEDKEMPGTAERILLKPLSGADEKYSEYSLLPVRVTAHMKGGGKISAYAELPTGHPDGPAFGIKEVMEKFLALGEPVLGRDAATHLSERIFNLENEGARNALRSVETARLAAAS